MGLDWNPLNKPRPGKEAEFEKILNKLLSGSTWREKSRRARFEAISITPYETLGAPQVGSSREADQWALEQYELQKPSQSREEWLRSHRGFYVLALVPRCDGIPVYSNAAMGYVEEFSFRADSLRDCTEIIGEPLLDSAYEAKLARDSLVYADELNHRAQSYSRERRVQIPAASPDDPDCIEFRLRVVVSAARWCRFWAERGHGFEAYS